MSDTTLRPGMRQGQAASTRAAGDARAAAGAQGLDEGALGGRRLAPVGAAGGRPSGASARRPRPGTLTSSPRSSSSATTSRDTKPMPSPACTERLIASFESSSQRFAGLVADAREVALGDGAGARPRARARAASATRGSAVTRPRRSSSCPGRRCRPPRRRGTARRGRRRAGRPRRPARARPRGARPARRPRRSSRSRRRRRRPDGARRSTAGSTAARSCPAWSTRRASASRARRRAARAGPPACPPACRARAARGWRRPRRPRSARLARPLRSTSFSPTAASSVFRCFVAEGWPIRQASAAAEIEPRRPTSTSSRSRCGSSASTMPEEKAMHDRRGSPPRASRDRVIAGAPPASHQDVPTTVEQLLAAARATLQRLSPEAADTAVRWRAQLVDIRSDSQRLADGLIPRAHVVARNVLEWRLDPPLPAPTLS